MTTAYSKELMTIARKCASKMGIDLKEGVYAYLTGPSYETPAEIRMFRTLGADAVGMSTVPEVIIARHSGLEVLGISCIANLAAGMLETPLNHQEVLLAMEGAKDKFVGLIKAVLNQDL
jgi:purine-nucleoside phosphorylase